MLHCYLRMTVGLLVLAACSDASSDPSPAEPSEHPAPDAGDPDAGEPDAADADAGPRTLERTVRLDLPGFATRALRAGPAGELVYGDVELLDGVETCIVQQRAAFDLFAPFVPLAEPLCVHSQRGQFARIEGAPANSDLLLTSEHEGLMPMGFVTRTGDFGSLQPPGWAVAGFSAMFLQAAATDPWIEPVPAAGANQGLVLIWAGSLWSGEGNARPEALQGRETFFGRVGGVAWGLTLHVVIEPAGGGDVIETTTRDTPRFVRVPEGSARIRFSTDDPHLNCRPTELNGLPTQGADTFELPVLAGYSHAIGVVCMCAAAPDDGELLDLGACSFAPGDTDEDAGAAP